MEWTRWIVWWCPNTIWTLSMSMAVDAPDSPMPRQSIFLLDVNRSSRDWCISRHLYSFITNIYTSATKTQKQWMKLNLNIISFIYDGCNLEMPQIRYSHALWVVWLLTILLWAMRWSYDSCKCITTVDFEMFSNLSIHDIYNLSKCNDCSIWLYMNI
jgi:hypothetical protein